MKRKESWRRAVIVLGITFVFGGITGENIPQGVCANPYYDPLVQDIDVPSEVCSELYEMVTDYLNSGEDGDKKKLVKKLKKQEYPVSGAGSANCGCLCCTDTGVCTV